MEFSQNVLTAAKQAIKKFPNDVSKAVDEAEKTIRELPEFKSLVDTLVRSAIQDLVYDARHRHSVSVKRGAGCYGTPPKTLTGASPGVRRVSESVYSFHIAGTTLGRLKGGQLLSIAENERAIATGHSFNARLCLKLKSLVKDDQTVREAVSEQRLRSIFREVQKEVKTTAA